MRVSRHTFEHCKLGVERHEGGAATLHVVNEDQGETYSLPLDDSLRRWLIQQLSGVQIVSPATELQHH